MHPSAPTSSKREIWPIAIVLSFVFFISFVLFWVYIMTNSKSELISANYYEQEMNYQQQIDKKVNADRMNKKIKQGFDPSGTSVEFTFPAEKGAAVSGTLLFMRPSDSRQDFTMAIATDSAGIFRVPLDSLSAGLWMWKADWKEGETGFYQEEYISF